MGGERNWTGNPRGTVLTKELPRDERVPTRGQSTYGPTVVGWTHCDDGMEHAWSPGRSAAGRRLHPLNGWRRRRVRSVGRPERARWCAEALIRGKPAASRSSKIKRRAP